MKILFYDIKNFEFDYLLDKISNDIEPFFIRFPLNRDTYIDEKQKDAEAISVFVSSWLDEATLSKFKNLKFIFLRCVGYSNIDLDYCKKNDIKVFNTPNYGNSTVAEYVFSLILSLTKKIPSAREAVFDGVIDHNELMGVELNSKTLGVIGLGAIGKRVADIAKAFDMKVIVYDIAKNGEYNFVEFDELLAQSDFISINCPLTNSTRGMFNSKTLSKMKKTAYLINAARGEVVDTKDLYEALINNKIKGAALDVVECEETLCQLYPKCDSHESLRINCLKKFFFIQKLLKLPQVIITPHVAYNTVEAQTRILEMTLENIQTSLNLNNISSVKNLVLL